MEKNNVFVFVSLHIPFAANIMLMRFSHLSSVKANGNIIFYAYKNAYIRKTIINCVSHISHVTNFPFLFFIIICEEKQDLSDVSYTPRKESSTWFWTIFQLNVFSIFACLWKTIIINICVADVFNFFLSLFYNFFLTFYLKPFYSKIFSFSYF